MCPSVTIYILISSTKTHLKKVMGSAIIDTLYGCILFYTSGRIADIIYSTICEIIVCLKTCLLLWIENICLWMIYLIFHFESVYIYDLIRSDTCNVRYQGPYSTTFYIRTFRKTWFLPFDFCHQNRYIISNLCFNCNKIYLILYIDIVVRT